MTAPRQSSGARVSNSVGLGTRMDARESAPRAADPTMNRDDPSNNPTGTRGTARLASIRARLVAPLRREWFSELGAFGDDFFSDD